MNRVFVAGTPDGAFEGVLPCDRAVDVEVLGAAGGAGGFPPGMMSVVPELMRDASASRLNSKMESSDTLYLRAMVPKVSPDAT